MCTCEEPVTHTGPVWLRKDVLARNLVGVGGIRVAEESLRRGETYRCASDTPGHGGCCCIPYSRSPSQTGYPRPGGWGDGPAQSPVERLRWGLPSRFSQSHTHGFLQQGPCSPCQEAAGGLGTGQRQVIAVDRGGEEGTLRLHAGRTAQRAGH